jgi:S-disulfanyl-L-cysteine oxidoreductase SoxD
MIMSRNVRPMQVLNAALAIFVVVAVAAMRSPVRAAARQAPGQTERSVADGIYTDAQRTRGQAIYTAECADCHAADLTGGDTAPSLSGYEFLAAWKGTTVGELFEKIGTMPPTTPGKLSPQQSADVLAFILSKNNFRAGATELAGDVAALKAIKFEGQTAADAAPEPNRSVMDGVYTEEQNRRGQAVYADACASCHAAALTGADVVPALVGADFLGKWTGATAGELFERIRTTMPQASPGSLSPQQYADIVAHIFNKNRFPAGRTPLDGDAAALGMIRIETTKKR